ncbi:hypothetical protein [Paraburkholderia solisilvae]|uniref:Glycosyltransferase RgtA/B/C/D-like domain-containing protein n=1 Tax=Paraburkholderia solisilvae TaxID=624376 RepID=A0A6J5EKM6_9BURK|nr:hypothetical protein [Paraburkholderia solisilvae]CAB3765816.1 hypothetical protein LMG29739_04667 [Paraburkholderia solisilvae]
MKALNSANRSGFSHPQNDKLVVLFATFNIIVCLAGIINILATSSVLTILDDSIGYLYPAAHYMDGQPYVHTNGRGFVFPMFLTILMEIHRSQRTILIAQHALYCITLVCCWIVMVVIFKSIQFKTRVSWVISAILFSTGFALFCFNGSALALAYTVMPEPLYSALLTLVILLIAMHFSTKKSTAKKWTLLSLAFLGAVIPLVKPHFILSAVATPLTVAINSKKTSRKAAFAIAMAGLFLVTPLYLFEKTLQKKYDFAVSTTFGPETLFCNNADIVYRYLNQKQPQTNIPLQLELKKILDAGPGWWVLNGFNGDKCMYGPAAEILSTTFHKTPVAASEFFIQTYIQSALYSPTIVANRIGTQFSYLTSFPLSAKDAPTPINCNIVSEGVKLGSLFATLHDECMRDLGKNTSFRTIDPDVFNALFVILIPLAAVTLFVCMLSRKARAHIPMEIRATFISLFSIYVSTNLLIALVHTFDIERYIAMQAPLMVCLFASSIAVVVSAAQAILNWTPPPLTSRA